MSYQFFIAGTDTDVGKTFVSTALLHATKKLGMSTAALKPIAAGSTSTATGLRNADALLLQQTMTANLDYSTINPIVLAPAIAPHIALEQSQQQLDTATLAAYCRPVLNNTNHDFILVEGAGGWRVPINSQESLANLAIELSLPIILIIGLRLGCINHGLLTAEAIERDGLRISGWVANQLDPNMEVVDDNIAALRDRLSAPLLGHIPFLHNPCAIDAAKYVDIHKLLE